MTDAQIRQAFARHKKAALLFSGGKDSLACLWLLEAFWPHLTVVWANAGDAFPETKDLMRQVQAMVPHFHEVKSDVRAQQAKWGYPVDVLPLRNHVSVGAALTLAPRPKLQSFMSCCTENLWLPMDAALRAAGVTLVVSGQRKSDVQKASTKVEGFEVILPIEDWTTEEVLAYVADKPIGLPANYELMETGLDCMHCTGHLFENGGKRTYMKQRHPEAFAEVSRRLDVIAAEVDRDMAHLHAARREGEPTQ